MPLAVILLGEVFGRESGRACVPICACACNFHGSILFVHEYLFGMTKLNHRWAQMDTKKGSVLTRLPLLERRTDFFRGVTLRISADFAHFTLSKGV